MTFTCVFFGLFFTAAGILFAAGKLHPHLSVWKNMPPEEKEHINMVPLSRNIGEIIALSGILFLMNGIFPPVHRYWFTLAMIAWLVTAGLDLWFISKSSRFKR